MVGRKHSRLNLVGMGMTVTLLLMAMSLSWAAGGSLSGAGATFPYPLYSKWFDVHKREHNVAISYQAIGSGGGIRQLKAGTVDFGASDAPLSDQELKEMPGKVLHLPMVAGAVAIVYNVPGVGSGLRLTGNVIADIFLGNVKRWNDKRIASLNPGVSLPNLPIAVVHRSDGSGTSHLFTSYLSAVSRAWAVRVGAGKAVLAGGHWRQGQRWGSRDRKADSRRHRLCRAGLCHPEQANLRAPSQPRREVHRAQPCKHHGCRCWRGEGDAEGCALLHCERGRGHGLPDRGIHLSPRVPATEQRRHGSNAG